MERPRPTDEQIANAQSAIQNGNRVRREAQTLFDLRTHYKRMSRGFPPVGKK